jgi:hypothetical protein
MHRWMYILDSVNKYYACYDAIDRRNQSGKTIQGKVSVNVIFFHISLILEHIHVDI